MARPVGDINISPRSGSQNTRALASRIVMWKLAVTSESQRENERTDLSECKRHMEINMDSTNVKHDVVWRPKM